MQTLQIKDKKKEAKKQDKLCVGIDFGTTNSLVAIYEDGESKIIEFDGKKMIPTIIDWSEGDIKIGKIRGEQYIKSIKRLFAKDGKDLQEDPKLEHILQNVEFYNNDPVALINGEKLSMPELASHVFKHLKAVAEQKTGKLITEAVISVPAYYDSRARGQIVLAAKLAGINVKRLLQEPTAAACAYGLDSNSEGGYMVYDLGGGTFDVAFLLMRTSVVKLSSIGGHPTLGGDDFDKALAKYISDETGLALDKELILKAKDIKHELSEYSKAIFRQGDIELAIGRSKFEEIVMPLIMQTVEIAKKTMFDENARDMRLMMMRGIILVGGATRMPIIKDILEEEFGKKIYEDPRCKANRNPIHMETYDYIDPDTVVAIGAARQSASISGIDSQFLVEAVPLSICVEMEGGYVEKIIKRNDYLPASASMDFTTQADNQTAIKIHIVQGEREKASDCRSIARFEIDEIPPGPAGFAKITLTVNLDHDGLLHISAFNQQTKKVKSIEIKSNANLNESIVDKMLEDAYKNAKKDFAEKEESEAVKRAESLIKSLEGALEEFPDLIDAQTKSDIITIIDDLKKQIELDDKKKVLEITKSLKIISSEFGKKCTKERAKAFGL